MQVTKLPSLPQLPKKRKVAAYARVSSGKDAMLNSLSQQVSYFSSLIQSNTDWVYAGVYVDEAITGTKDDRTEFQRMLQDCKEGNYVIKNEDIHIEIIDKKIDAQSIYDKIYSTISVDNNEVEIIITTDLKEKEEQIIFKQIKNMFEKIDKAINQQLDNKN